MHEFELYDIVKTCDGEIDEVDNILEIDGTTYYTVSRSNHHYIADELTMVCERTQRQDY